jgi:hypothetical protein
MQEHKVVNNSAEALQREVMNLKIALLLIVNQLRADKEFPVRILDIVERILTSGDGESNTF